MGYFVSLNFINSYSQMPEEPNYQSLTVIEIIEETPDAKTFKLKAIGDEKIVYKSGQFITFIFNKGDKEERRSYSISSSPEHDDYVSITVKRVENGEYSRFFINNVQVGDQLLSSGVGGLFVLADDLSAYKQLFFLAAGSGITPVYSLIKKVLKIHPQLSIVLIYSNRSPEDTIFYEELVELANASKGKLLIDFLFSSSNNILKSRLNNSLLTAMLAQYGNAKKEEILCYICGPVEYMDTVGITLLTEGIPKDNLHKENFVTYVPEITATPPDRDRHKVTIKLKDKTVALQVQYPISILHQAQNDGIALPYSCESGQCGSCVARCTRGRVWIAYNEVLTDRELDQGLVLTCQGFPVGGDVELEF